METGSASASGAVEGAAVAALEVVVALRGLSFRKAFSSRALLLLRGAGRDFERVARVVFALVVLVFALDLVLV
jgi:hypothetical protein